METLSHIAGIAILVCGALTMAGMLVYGVLWSWWAALAKARNWRTLLLLTAKSLHGKDYNRELVLPALKEWIGDSDSAAYSALNYIRRLRPNAEHCFDDHAEETP